MGFFGDLFGSNKSGDIDWTSLASEGLNLYSQYSEGSAKKSAYESKASSSRDTAAYEMQRAADADKIGSETLEKYGVSAQRYMGKQMAAQGASGIVAGSGSFQDVNRATQATLGQDMQTIMRNTMREAYGHTLAAKSNIVAANEYSNAGNNAWTNSQLGIAGSIITGDLADGLVKKYWE